jgi:hypothetical protein
MYQRTLLAIAATVFLSLADSKPASAACDLGRYGQDVHFCCVNGWLTILQAAARNDIPGTIKYFNFCQQHQPNGGSNARNAYFCSVQRPNDFLSTTINQCENALDEFAFKARSWRRF